MMGDLIKWLVKSSEDLQIILFFSLVITFFFLENVKHFRKINRGRRMWVNYLFTLLSLFVLIGIPFSFFSASEIAAKIGWGLLNSLEIDFIFVFLITMFIRSFISFLTHYLAHKVPIFWRVHRVHHLDLEMDVSTTVRFHPLEFVINLLIGVPVVLLFGLPIWGLLLYELFDIIITLFSHSNIIVPEKFDKYIRYLIVTPNLHRVHHSSFQPETDSNFGAVFPFWDLIFGTFKTKEVETQKIMELGLNEVRDSRVNNPLWILISPFVSIKK